MAKFYLKSMGCKSNQFEGQIITEKLLEKGFENVKDFKELINENKQKEQTMDNSFFTSSIKLKKGDFVNYKDKKPSAFKTIIITILILGIITAIGVLVAKKLGFF